MNIAKTIDHTNIREHATAEDIKKLCSEAKEHGFHGVVVNPEWVRLAAEEVKGSDIKVVVLVDPPMGLSSHEERVRICEQCKEDGAHELDIVMNVVDMKHERYSKILSDLTPICAILPTKVIIGSGYLTDGEIKKASELTKEAGAICVKTATSKDPLEEREVDEKAHHIELMKEHAPGLLVKASGNIRTHEQAKRMIESGADIIGTSSGVEIVKE